MLDTQSTLSKHELAVAKGIVAAIAPGKYTTRELHGSEWEWIIRKRAYGKWFKAAVLHDDLPGVRLVGKKSNKSLLYEVLRPIRNSAPEHLTVMPIPSKTFGKATLQAVSLE